jgi:uncharacterized cupin superfamily protein
MSAVKIIRFGVDPPAPETSRPGTVTDGDPVTTTHNYYADSSNRFFSGIWESTPGKWDCDYSESEFVYLISGRAKLTDAEGRAETFGPGSAFVIPAGFKGSWETLETLKKYYAIFN